MSDQERQDFLSSGDLMSISEAACLTPYSPEYLSLRARAGKLKALKLGRNWVTTKGAVLEYLREQEAWHRQMLDSICSCSSTSQGGFGSIKMLFVLAIASFAVSSGLLGAFRTASLFTGSNTSPAQKTMSVSKTNLTAAAGAEAVADADALEPLRGEVLGQHVTMPAPAPGKNVGKAAAASPDMVSKAYLDQRLDEYLKFIGGFLSSQQSGSQPAYAAQPVTPTVSGVPIMTFVPAAVQNNFSGGSIAGFNQLSSQGFTSDSANITGTLSVPGTANFSGATSFNGTTTITNLVVSGFNPGLTGGSVLFQGTGGIAQDNANLFYDAVNHRLGIGTASPAAPLHVISNNIGGTSIVLENSDTGGHQWRLDSTGSSNTGGAGNFRVVDATASAAVRMLIDNNGNVGVGTVSPSEKFNVQGDMMFAGTAGFLGSFGYTTKDSNIFIGSNIKDVGLIPTQVDTSVPSWISRVGGSASDSYQISRIAAGSSYNGRNVFLSILNNGNVGIGTSSPIDMLHVVNNSQNLLGLTLQTASSRNTISTHPIMMLLNTDTTANNGLGLRFSSSDLSGNTRTAAQVGTQIISRDSSSVSGDMYFATVYNSNFLERMRITNAGNVGIGTVSPNDKLEVNGNIRLTGGSNGQIIFSDGSTMSSAYLGSATSMANANDVVTTADSDMNGTGAIVWKIGNSEKLRMLNNGNIGIGTAAPTAALTFGGDSTINSFGAISILTNTISNLTLDSGTTGAINIGTNANAKTITLGNSTGATSVVINNGTGALNIGTNAIAHTVTIGNVTGATAVNINTGTGNFALNSNMLNLIRSTGFVGIGSSTPQARLTVAGTSTAPTAVLFNVTSSTNGSLFNVQSNGSVGIGTYAPSYALDVNGVVNALGLKINGVDVSTASSSVWSSGGGAAYYTAGNVGVGTSTPNSALSVAGDINFTGNLLQNGSLYTGSQWVTGSSSAVYYSSGNVGIGTSSPAAQFDVEGLGGVVLNAGNVTVGSGSSGLNNTNVIVNDIYGATISGGSSGAAVYGTNLYWDNNTVKLRNLGTHGSYGYGGIVIGGGNNSGSVNDWGNITFYGRKQATVAGAAIAEQTTPNMVIKNNGYVGIGTSTPAYTLDVNGPVNATALLINGSPVQAASGTTTPWYGDSNSIFYNTGNVGIGTVSPTEKLQVAGTGNLLVGNYDTTVGGTDGKIRVQLSDADNGREALKAISSKTSYYNIAVDATAAGVGAIRNVGLYGYASGATTNWGLEVASGDAVILSGNLGVSTTTPTQKLTVANGNILFNKNYGLYWNDANMSIVADSANNLFTFQSYTSANQQTFKFRNSSSASDLMTILGNGNIGIGTSTPGSQLDIVSTSTAGNTPRLIIENSSGVVLPLAFGPGIVLDNHISGSHPFIIEQNQTSASPFSIGRADSPYTGYFTINQDGSVQIPQGVFDVGGKLSVVAGGNVGIGNTNPQYKLDVNGSVNAASLLINGVPVSASTDTFWSSSTSGSIYYAGGNVGIGTIAPTSLLTVGNGTHGYYSPGTSALTVNGPAEFGSGLATVSLGVVNNSGSLSLDSGNFLGGFTISRTMGITNNDYTLFSWRNLILSPQTGYNTIFSQGNVGIGTTSPAGQLHIQVGAIGTKGLVVQGAAGQTANLQEWQASTGGFVSYVNSSGSFYTTSATGYQLSNGRLWQLKSDATTFNIYDGSVGATRVTVDNNGNVGIGNATPAYKLDVSGITHVFKGAAGGVINPATTASLAVENSDDNAIQIFSPTNKSGQVLFGSSINGAQGSIIYQHSPSATTDYMSFSVLAQERMRIDVNGNLGIGTQAPAQALDIGGAGADMIFSDATAYHQIMTGGATNLALMPGGNVGVGTLSPQYKLDVNGVVNATGLKINGVDVSTASSSVWSSGGGAAYYTAGNVGVGTSTPNDRLAVVSDGINPALEVYSNSAISQFVVNANGNVGISTTTPNGLLDVNGYLTVSPSGNVGIGTTSPTAKLNVAGDIRISSGGVLYFADGSSMSSANLGSANALSNATDTVVTSDADADGVGDIIFKNGSTERMRVNSSGVLTYSNNLLYGSQIKWNTGLGAITHILGPADTTFTINSAAANALALDSGTTGAVNIGTNANAKTITIGNSTGATSIVLNNGTGALNLGTNAVAHTITLGNSTGATSIVLNNGTGALSLGTNAIAHTVAIGNSTGATAVNINTGTGNFALNTNQLFVNQTSGNVGIGSAAPGVKLFVNGSAVFSGPSNATSTAVDGELVYDTVAHAYKYFNSASGTFLSLAAGNINYTGTLWSQNGSNISYASGNVTVGTTSSVNLFSVYGGAAIGQGYESITAPINGLLVKGNVGIGTTTVPQLLSVAGGSYFAGNVGVGTTSPIASVAVTGTAGLNPFVIASSTGAQLFNITQSGNVGIGAIAPAVALEVNNASTAGQARFYGYTPFGTAAANSNNGVIYIGGGGTSTFAGAIGYNGNTNRSLYIANLDASANTRDIIFMPSNAESVRFSGTGNVGIGTTSPIARLTVVGTSTVPTGVLLNIASSTNVSLFNVQSSGTVGIGSTSPNARLTISGVSTAPTAVLFNVTSSTNASLFNIQSTGNVGIGTSTPNLGPLTMASGAYVTAGGVWTNASDRSLKENFATITPASILEKINQLPVMQWNYKNEDPAVKHIGPIAQDFYAIFQVGNSSTSISTIDPSGVALLGIQALDGKVTSLQYAVNNLQGQLTGNASSSSLLVFNPSGFSGDSVGQAKILAGATSVKITFRQPYKYQPVITALPLGRTLLQHQYSFVVDDVDSHGFTIYLDHALPVDAVFDWHAFASVDEQLFVSDGTAGALQLVTQAQPAPVAEIILPSAPSAPAVEQSATGTDGSVSSDVQISSPVTAQAPANPSAPDAGASGSQSE